MHNFKEFLDYCESFYLPSHPDVLYPINGLTREELALATLNYLDLCASSYQGEYSSGAEFAEQLAVDCCEVPSNLSSWIEIDWKASWDNLSYDYCEQDGYIFSQNF